MYGQVNLHLRYMSAGISGYGGLKELTGADKLVIDSLIASLFTVVSFLESLYILLPPGRHDILKSVVDTLHCCSSVDAGARMA